MHRTPRHALFPSEAVWLVPTCRCCIAHSASCPRPSYTPPCSRPSLYFRERRRPATGTIKSMSIGSPTERASSCLSPSSPGRSTTTTAEQPRPGVRNICICIYICMYTCMYVCIHLCVTIYNIHKYIYLYLSIYLYMHAYMYVYIYIYTHMHAPYRTSPVYTRCLVINHYSQRSSYTILQVARHPRRQAGRPPQRGSSHVGRRATPYDTSPVYTQ